MQIPEGEEEQSEVDAVARQVKVSYLMPLLRES